MIRNKSPTESSVRIQFPKIGAIDGAEEGIDEGER
jgi:hypothetical protein